LEGQVCGESEQGTGTHSTMILSLMGWDEYGRENTYRTGSPYKQYWELNQINKPISRPRPRDEVDIMGVMN